MGCECNKVCAECKRKVRPEAEMRDMVNRLSRIEGQIRGLRGMVEKSAYCVDILTQVSAVQAALNAFSKALLREHIKTCVVDDIRAGHDEVDDELLSTLQKMMK